MCLWLSCILFIILNNNLIILFFPNTKSQDDLQLNSVSKPTSRFYKKTLKCVSNLKASVHQLQILQWLCGPVSVSSSRTQTSNPAELLSWVSSRVLLANSKQMSIISHPSYTSSTPTQLCTQTQRATLTAVLSCLNYLHDVFLLLFVVVVCSKSKMYHLHHLV